MTVFMMVFNPTGYNNVVPLIEYFSEQVSNSIESFVEESITQGPPYKEKIVTETATATEKQLQFSINKYYSEPDGLTGNYDDFFTYTNLTRNEQNILSPNEQKLKAFCAYINRLTN